MRRHERLPWLVWHSEDLREKVAHLAHLIKTATKDVDAGTAPILLDAEAQPCQPRGGLATSLLQLSQARSPCLSLDG